MADLTVTAASVLATDTAITEVAKAGEAATAGMSAYRSSADKRWYKSDKDVAEATAEAYGVFLSSPLAAAVPCIILRSGKYNPGATVAIGTAYVVGEAAGGIAPITDVGTGERPRLLGFATTAAQIDVQPVNPGVAVP